MPAKKGKQPDEKYALKLTAKQRDSLVHAIRLTLGLKKKIEESPDDQQFVEFTKKELERMGEEIDTLLDYLEEKHLMEKRKAVDRSGAIYQFKVTLKDSDPPIWRLIQIPDCTLGELHEVLQVVMGWDDCHLHQFIV